MEFEKQKEKQFRMKDQSWKGSIDKKITPLCERINKNQNYYTTSSCSGRIIIFRDRIKKQPDVFLKVWHS